MYGEHRDSIDGNDDMPMIMTIMMIEIMVLMTTQLSPMLPLGWYRTYWSVYWELTEIVLMVMIMMAITMIMTIMIKIMVLITTQISDMLPQCVLGNISTDKKW